MYTEVISVVVILGVCWVALAVLDVAVAGLLAWILGLSFKRCFAWGLLSLAVPVLLMGYGILIERNAERADGVMDDNLVLQHLEAQGLFVEGLDGTQEVGVPDGDRVHARRGTVGNCGIKCNGLFHPQRAV